MKTSDLSRACLKAYVDKSRDAAEALIASDFRFTSALDNALDRAAYFETCWPNSATMNAVQIVDVVDDGPRAFLIYEVNTNTKRFRNFERHIARDNKLVSVEVYFGWDLPHQALLGHHLGN